MDNKKSRLSNPVIMCLLALFCCSLWGSAFPCIKIGYELFQIGGNDSAGQILFAGMRFTLAGIMAVIIGSISAKKVLVPRKTAIPKVLVLALFQTVLQYVFFYIGVAHTTGVKASIINGSGVFMSIIAAAMFYKSERLTLQKIVGCLLGFVGIVLINLAKGAFDFSFTLMGEGFILLCAASSAMSFVCIKKFSQTENPVMLSGWQFIVGGIVMMIAGISFGGRIAVFTAGGIAMLCYLAFISAAAYSIWSLLLKHNPIAKVAIFGFANPIFGVILSTLLLHEGQNFGLPAVVALILVSAGIAIVYYQNPEK